MTGLTPSHFKNLKLKRLDTMGNMWIMQLLL
jgi:hypothetical protein